MVQRILTSLDLGNNLIQNLAAPVSANDAANKQYVDNAIQGLKWKDQVRAATTANVTLTGTQTVDGVALIATDRVLVKNQSTSSANGIYVVSAGAWSRSTDADTAIEVAGMAVFVQEGAANGNQQWVCTTDGVITLNTTSLTFVQVGSQTAYSAGTGISIGGGVISVDTAVTARKAGVTIGDNAATSFNIAHNFGSTDVVVLIREVSSTKAQVYADVVITDTNTVTVSFATAPTTGQYRVSVVG